MSDRTDRIDAILTRVNSGQLSAGIALIWVLRELVDAIERPIMVAPLAPGRPPGDRP